MPTLTSLLLVMYIYKCICSDFSIHVYVDISNSSAVLP